MESPRRSVSATTQVAGLGGGGMAGPTKVHSALEGIAVVVESLGLAAAESTVEKETSVGPVAEVEGIAAERWEMISKRNAISTMAPKRLAQNQIEGSNREFKERPAG